MKFYIFFVLLAASMITFMGLTAENTQAEPGVIFSHQYHIDDEELGCDECHEAAATSESGEDNLFPDHDVCSSCHDVDEEDACGDCHTNADDPSGFEEISKYSSMFSHKRHVDKNLECVECHDAISEKTFVMPYILPTMVNCVECHESQNASLECESCHTADENLRPFSHSENFTHNHSDLAPNGYNSVSDGMSCATCHDENYCQDCHQGYNLDRMTHPLNYAFNHSLEAQGKQKDCSSCHVDKLFCNECHNQYQLMPHNHTAGWTVPSPGDGGRHRTEAMNDLDNCRSCHEQNADLVCGNAGCHPQGTN